MRFAFVNPNWSFSGSTYFGCRDPHYPLELLYAREKVRQAGHDALLVDAQVEDLSIAEVRDRMEYFQPDFLVIPSAPSYLFWRCPQPELRVPMEWLQGLASDSTAGGRASGMTKVVIGPHASATPAAVFAKTGCDVAFKGEPDAAIAQLADRDWKTIAGCCFRDRVTGELHIAPGLASADMKSLGAIDFSDYPVEQHAHRHHVFTGHGRGAELEFARGCPWACTFCNKTLFRNQYRERDIPNVLREVDALVARGVDYIYFIDEIFGVGRNVRGLLRELAERPISIGFQTRIDLWDEGSLDLLGRAHCISMECGVESITDAGRDELNKNCRIGTDRISELLIYARKRIPWVQANLILTEQDDKGEIARWQAELKAHGVWVSEPVPMFPFPGSPLYIETFGVAPDDQAWERAHHFYTSRFSGMGFSDIQEARPAPIEQLEDVA